MKERSIILLFFVLFLSFFTFAQAYDKITGEVITGKVSYDQARIEVFIAGIPAIILNFPENKTYITNELELRYNYSGSPDTLEYSINDFANISLNANMTMPLVFSSNGLKKIDLWAGNGYGFGNYRTYFTINTSLLVINYSNFNGSTKGLSTDFKSFDYETLTNLSNVVIEDTRYGKIEFTEVINVENDSNISSNIVDLNSNVLFSNGSISLNSENLPNFNKSASLSFYFLSYTDPIILIDGVVCLESVCSNRNYSNGNLSFDVNHFSTYSVVETVISLGGGGGGTRRDSILHFLDMITIGIVQIGENDEIVIPVTVFNNEKITMKGIKLYSTSNNNNNNNNNELSSIFEDITINELLPGQNKTLMLFLKSSELNAGKYEIKLYANVTDPKFTQEESLYVEVIEVIEKTGVMDRILLAQELFEENPECIKLKDLLVKCWELLDEDKVMDAKMMIVEAISKCRNLVTNKEFPLQEKEERGIFFILLLVGIIILLILFIFHWLRSIKLKKKNRR
jgi:hypothetical protein